MSHRRKKVVVLGSTGSIGRAAIRVIAALPDRLELVGLAAFSDYRQALDQAARFNVKRVAVADEAKARLCASMAPHRVKVLSGAGGVECLAALPDADVILCAVVGMAGLRPVMAAINAGKDVALATKEVLVAAGRVVTEACNAGKVRLLPVDSEHSAIFQCLENKTSAKMPTNGVRRLILTASGGPFAARPRVNLDKVTIRQVLRHPTWKMGRKVTVDSATLMNKGLEIIEAHWLFGMPVSSIDVVLHPESIVHSLVEFVDGNIAAQLSVPDMRFAIQYALTYPERVRGNLPRLDLSKLGALHFSEPDSRRFPCLDLARDAARTGGTMPAVLNAANEVAVRNFLQGRMPFSGMWQTVESVMARHETGPGKTLEEILEADGWARKEAENYRCRKY